MVVLELKPPDDSVAELEVVVLVQGRQALVWEVVVLELELLGS